jgi:hypothetical protein
VRTPLGTQVSVAIAFVTGDRQGLVIALATTQWPAVCSFPGRGVRDSRSSGSPAPARSLPLSGLPGVVTGSPRLRSRSFPSIRVQRPSIYRVTPHRRLRAGYGAALYAANLVDPPRASVDPAEAEHSPTRARTAVFGARHVSVRPLTRIDPQAKHCAVPPTWRSPPGRYRVFVQIPRGRCESPDNGRRQSFVSRCAGWFFDADRPNRYGMALVGYPLHWTATDIGRCCGRSEKSRSRQAACESHGEDWKQTVAGTH